MKEPYPELTPLARALAACEAQERKNAVMAKMIQFAIALPPDELHAVAPGVHAIVFVHEYEGYEYRQVDIETDGNTVAAITWHGHFTDPAYTEHDYQPGAWEAAVIQ